MAEAMVASKSFVRRRFRPSHAKQRSTTHRRGCTSSPTCPGILRTISMAMEVASRTRWRHRQCLQRHG